MTPINTQATSSAHCALAFTRTGAAIARGVAALIAVAALSVGSFVVPASATINGQSESNDNGTVPFSGEGAPGDAPASGPQSGSAAPKTQDSPVERGVPASAEDGQASGSEDVASDSEMMHEQPTTHEIPSGGFFRRARQNNNPMSCVRGSIFSIQRDGEILRIDSDSSLHRVSQLPAPRTQGTIRANALAIGVRGEEAYALRHWLTQADNAKPNYAVYHYTADRGWRSLSNQTYQSPVTSNFVAGAIQLKPNGQNKYYVGAFTRVSTSDNREVFRLFAVDLRDGRLSQQGYFFTGSRTGQDGSNGDMAFDDEGNLYVVRGENNTASIFSVLNEDLSAGGELAARHAGEVSIANHGYSGRSGINGIAFDSHGRLYLGNLSQITRHDPIDFERVGVLRSDGLGASTDLASCDSPTSLRIRKNITERVNARDQFKLTLTKLNPYGNPSIPSATTSGSNNGVQRELVGVYAVRSGTRFRFSEEMAPRSHSSMQDYVSSWECVKRVGSQRSVIGSGDGTSGEVEVPAEDGASLTCTFLNKPVRGTLTWQKVSSAEPATYLEGSEWTLTGPIPNGSAVITDCVGDCANNRWDKDGKKGYFQLEQLPLGEYQIVEKTPPIGYKKTTRELRRTLDRRNRSHDFGAVANEPNLAEISLVKELQDVDGQALDADGWQLKAALSDDTHAAARLTPSQGNGGRQTPWLTTPTSGQVAQTVSIQVPRESGNVAQGGVVKVLVSEKVKPGVTQVAFTCSRVDGRGQVVGQPVVSRQAIAPQQGVVTARVDNVSGGTQLRCAFVNKRDSGELTWAKTDEAGNALGGSVWQLATQHQGTIAVEDCVARNRCANLWDKDPRPGFFQVRNLKWGRVTLSETQPPVGYVRDSGLRNTELKPGALSHDFGSIVNVQVNVPSIPFTGGVGADTFMILGGGAAILAAALWQADRRRRRVGARAQSVVR